MSNRIYGIDKVEKNIGMPGKDINKIDIYFDINNPYNIWGMIYYTEYLNRKPIVKQEVARFSNCGSMLNYLKDNFDCYELNHEVDPSKKKIFFHYIDYCNAIYYVYDGWEKKNYMELNYKEHDNGKTMVRTMKLPKDCESVLIDILKTSKNIPSYKSLNSDLLKKVDVFNEKNQKSQEIISKYTMPMGELLKKSGEKIVDIKDRTNKKSLIKGLKITISTIALATILGGGYKLVTDNMHNSEFITQTNPITNAKDVGLYINKGNAGKIIDKLMEDNYEEVSPEELKDVLEFIRELDNANYDNNASFNSFNYQDYFDYKLLENKDYVLSRDILSKIERLYKDSFSVSGGKIYVKVDNAKKYIDYVSSLTFMYDTYHTTRAVTHVDIETQSIVSKSATNKEIEIYDKYPAILKYIILNQLKGMISRVDYQVKEQPSYYFKGTNRYDLLVEISKKSDNLLDEMYFKCGANYRHKGM